MLSYPNNLSKEQMKALKELRSLERMKRSCQLIRGISDDD